MRNKDLLLQERERLRLLNEEKICLIHDRIIKYNNLPEKFTFSQPSRRIISKFSKFTGILAFYELERSVSWNTSASLFKRCPVWIEEIRKEIICIITDDSNITFYSLNDDQIISSTKLENPISSVVILLSRNCSTTILRTFHSIIEINRSTDIVKISRATDEIPILTPSDTLTHTLPNQIPPNAIAIVDHKKFLIKNSNNTLALLSTETSGGSSSSSGCINNIITQTHEMPSLIYYICHQERKIATLHQENSSSPPIVTLFDIDSLSIECIASIDNSSNLLLRSIHLLRGSKRFLINDFLVFSF